jgi:hypothetical protein
MQAPTRPFESLEWFREASTGDYRPRGPWRNALRWLRSSRCFAFHIGLFALGITIALALNVARSPGDIWVDRLAIGWAILLVIHAGIVLMIWATGLLTGNGNRAPVYPGTVLRPRQLPPVAPPPTAAQASTATATDWPAPPPEVAPVPEAWAAPAAKPSAWSPWGQQASTPGEWSTTTGTGTDTEPVQGPPAPADSRQSEPASWREASPGAWLGRRRPLGSNVKPKPVRERPTLPNDDSTPPPTED